MPLNLTPSGVPPVMPFEDLIARIDLTFAAFDARDATNAAAGKASGAPFLMAGLMYAPETGGTATDDLSVTDVAPLGIWTFATLDDVPAHVAEGQVISAANSHYTVLASAATDQNVTTSSGVKLHLTSAGLEYDPQRLQIRLTPAVPQLDTDPTSFPSTGAPYNNTIIAIDGPSGSTPIWRSTIVGKGAGSYALNDMDRVDAFGDGAVRFADMLDSVTAIGSLSYQWLGLQPVGAETLSEALARTAHEFVDDHDLTDPLWDRYSLETNNPGLRAQLAAVTLSTSKAQNEDNVGVGRNTGLHAVKGQKNSIGGKNAMAHMFYGYDNSVWGFGAFRDGALVNRSQALGSDAAFTWSEGTGNTVIGHGAGKNIHKGNFNLIIGNFAANEYTGEVNQLLWMGMGSTRVPLISGDFSDGTIGVNIAREDILAEVAHFRQGDSGVTSINIASDAVVIENSTSTGMTFAVPEGALVRTVAATPSEPRMVETRMVTDGVTQSWVVSFKGVDAVVLNSDGAHQFLNLPTSAPATPNTIWRDGNTVKIT